MLCCGSGKPRDLNVTGRAGDGIAFALDYLTAATRHVLDGSDPIPDDLNAKDKHVVVIGGGDTGTDCVGTALRQGCKSVRQLEIMPEPPASRTVQNPWPEYPKVLKTDYAQQEAIARFGDDPRHYLVQTDAILRDGHGRVCAVATHSIQWDRDSDGRMSLRKVEGTSKKWPADLVLLAMGFTGPEDTLVQAYGLTQDARSNIMANGFKTARKDVFAAGDMRTGQSLVVRAINDGQLAAAACNEYLKQKG